jgi:predicted ATP-dependent protease
MGNDILTSTFWRRVDVGASGDAPPLGGINEKIEGFFDVCRARGLTGRHGVMIPEANARHLMLREDVVQAVREGQFHVHTVSNVDEGLEILSGRPAGERSGLRGAFPEGSFNAEVEQALVENVERLKALRANSHGAATPSIAG